MSSPDFAGPWADAFKRIQQDAEKIWARVLPPTDSLDNPAIEAWRALFEGRKPAAERSFPGRVLDTGKAFLGLIESVAKGLSGKPGVAPHDVVQSVQQWLNGAQGFAASQQMFKPMLEPFAINLDSLRDFPTFGYSREKQAQQLQLSGDVSDYTRAFSAYQALMLKAQLDGMQRFQKSFGDDSLPPIDSLRGLYDAWVDAAEEAFAEAAMKPEFREVYGDLVNAQMRVKKHLIDQAQAVSRDFGMPTRSEVQSLAKAVHELKQTRRDVELLKREVAELKAAMVKPKAPVEKVSAPAVAKKSAPKSSAPAAKRTKKA
jgi:hypothetical protein